MKKVTMLMMLFTGIVVSVHAQKLSAAKVPSSVKGSFSKQFPGAIPTWEMEDGKYEASFKDKGKSMSALFSPNGMMTESEVGIKVGELPPAVLSYLKEHYKGVAIKEAAKITKADGSIHYEAEVNKKDVLFDVNGKFIKEARD